MSAKQNHVLNYSSDIVQSLSRVQLFATSWTAACQAVSSALPLSLLKVISMESVMLSNYVILCLPLLLHSVFPSIRVCSNERALQVRWLKHWSWSFSFSNSPSKEYSGLISFRIDWFDLLVAQETLKSLLQHHHSKASVLWHSAFFMV